MVCMRDERLKYSLKQGFLGKSNSILISQWERYSKFFCAALYMINSFVLYYIFQLENTSHRRKIILSNFCQLPIGRNVLKVKIQARALCVDYNHFHDRLAVPLLRLQLSFSSCCRMTQKILLMKLPGLDKYCMPGRLKKILMMTRNLKNTPFLTFWMHTPLSEKSSGVSSDFFLDKYGTLNALFI